MRPLDEQEARIFTLSDLRLLFRRKQATLLRAALLGWVAIFGLCLLQTPQYRIEAKFKESSEHRAMSSEGFLKEMFLSAGGNTGASEAAVAMKSYQVLKPLVARLGLQASVPQGNWVVQRLCRRIRDNLKAERGKPLEDADAFVFADVLYEGEGASYALRFDDASHFTVLDGKQAIAKGMLGFEVCLPDAQLILKKAPKNLRLHRLYPLHLQSWVPIAASLRSALKIISQKANQSIYEIVYLHRNRHQGTEIVNELMEQYRRYLKKGHDELAKAQIAYLDQRQAEMVFRVGASLQEHAEYLARNLEENGCTNLGEQVHDVLAPHRHLIDRLFAVEVELSRLEAFAQEEALPTTTGESTWARQFNEVARELGDLKQQRDVLELSLQHQKRPQLQEQYQELQAVRSKRQQLEQGEVDLPASLAAWAVGLAREDMAHYMQNQYRLLSLQEKMLQERFVYGSGTPQELEGIDLQTARRLFVEYNQKLDACEAAIGSFARLKEEIELPEFQLSSLSAILSDPLSQKLIAHAGDLSVRMHDEPHHTDKEKVRWTEELQLQKKILKDHLQQLWGVEQIHASLIREKMVGLQQLTLDCINRQISVLQEQARSAMQESKEALTIEKALLEQKITELRSSMKDFPERWRLEKWIDLKTRMAIKMMESVAQLVESTTISHQLDHIASKPLDLALVPKEAQSPHLFRNACAGAMAIAFGCFVFFLMQTLVRGFPSSFEKLRAMRFPLLGSISSSCDGPAIDVLSGGDLDVLRQLSSFLEKKVVGLLAGRGPDYSYALAAGLARRSLRSLVIRCDFRETYQSEDVPGLLQFWKGELPHIPLRRGNGFDVLPAGGFTPYGVEVVQSRAFQELLQSLKSNYDVLFLLFRAPLDTADAQGVLQLCDQAVVTVAGEMTEVLTPFVNWAYHEDKCRLMFMTVQSAF